MGFSLEKHGMSAIRAFNIPLVPGVVSLKQDHLGYKEITYLRLKAWKISLDTYHYHESGYILNTRAHTLAPKGFCCFETGCVALALLEVAVWTRKALSSEILLSLPLECRD